MAAKENSFDIVSQIDLQEVDNAVNQARREIGTRFDFRGSKCGLDFDGKEIILHADDDFKLKSLVDVLEPRLLKRKVDLKALRYGKVEKAAGDTVRQRVELIQGLDKEISARIIKLIKGSKLKIQASYQGDQVRVSGKSRDDLQAVIRLIREQEWEVPLQFINMRTM
ncbi:YajQ family cyclic di-GMP-binding protein [Desulfotomaculum copahuensis]|uniref:Nucleotide-binding protein A6M21_02670 n=1 Tax=Desulfotomaculum copahuensis TaxID=1838280 RepID=A0A1B7LJI8_9FIRM|nr:YajQ family cyclic di-GMP-binding protein [Desulfotomaculum copahuensis]OAT86737.1 YajQ family cyclic di-GMP-binding protein [Desulfotomaculum copahuensis]